MKKSRTFFILLSVLSILIAVLSAAALIGMYREGIAIKAEDPLAWVFTRDRFVQYFKPLLPLFIVFAVMSAFGLLRGLKYEDGKAGCGRRGADSCILQSSKEQSSKERSSREQSSKEKRRKIQGSKIQGSKIQRSKKQNTASGEESGRILRLVLLALALCLIAAGVFNGSARDVFGKAIKICSECIGLG